MPGNDAIDLEGEVVRVLPAGRLWVRLKNGHQMVGRVLRRRVAEVGPVQSGDLVRLSVCPSDMSLGVVKRVVERA
jgi:translation initiation factor IF-1